MQTSLRVLLLAPLLSAWALLSPVNVLFRPHLAESEKTSSPLHHFQDECPACEKGLVPCKSRQCSPKVTCRTDVEHVCDAMYRAECCQGFRKLPCKKCSTKEAVLARRAYDRTRREWLKRMREVDVRLGQRYAHIETEHFVVHNCHENWRFKSGKADRSRGAHIWAERLESLWQSVDREFGTPSGKGKHVLYMSWTREQHVAAHRHYGDKNVGNSWAGYNGDQGEACGFFIYPDQPNHFTDKGLDAFVHHVAALAVVGRLTPKKRLPFWFMKGAAHWLDLKKSKFKKGLDAFSADRNEWDKPGQWFKKSGWPKTVAKHLRKERVELTQIFTRSSADTLKGQALAWSVVNYLKRKKAGDKIKDLVAQMKKGKSFEDALQIAYGETLKDLEKGWRKYARAGKR